MFLSPMLLESISEPIKEPFGAKVPFISELKWDGFRLILSKVNGRIQLYTRHKTEITYQYKQFTNLDIPDGTVLDGELVALNEDGVPDFELLMESFKSNKSTHYVQFVVFDVLLYKGENITSYPLLRRKEILNKIIPQDSTLVAKNQYLVGHAEEYFQVVKENHLEGVCYKRADGRSSYEINKRSKNWLKLINYQYDIVSITGLRENEFGVYLSFLDGRAAGIMEFIPTKERRIIYEHARVNGERTDKNKIIFRTPLLCEVKYRNLTKNNLLRIPSFHRWPA